MRLKLTSLLLAAVLLLSAAPTYAQNPVVSRASYENALVNDSGFIARLDGFITKAATAVLAEDPGTSNHAARLAFAQKVLRGSRAFAIQSAGYLIHTDNFEGQTIQITPLGSGFVVTIATIDDNAYGQIFSVWSTLAVLYG